MKTTTTYRYRTRLIGLLLSFMLVFPAFAANECEVYYSFNNNGSAQSQTLTLDEGEVEAISQANVRYIQNKKNYPVQVEITNLWPPYGKKWVALNNSGQQDPPSGTYTGSVTLYNIECGGSAFPTPAQMIATLQAAGVPVEDIAEGLKDTFNQSGAQVAQLLEDANFTTTQIASALREAFNASGQQVAQWMAGAGIWARYVAVALEDTFNASGDQIATWLRQAGYSANQVTQGLIEAFNAGAEEAASWLFEAGFTLDQIAQALIEKFNVGAEAFIDALQYEVCGVAGCPSDRFRQMIEVLQSRFNQSAQQVFFLLEQSGYAIGAIVQGVNDVFNTSAQQLAEWMRQANVAAAEAAQALKEAFNASAEQVAQWLAQAGYTLNDVALALKDAFNASVATVAAVLESVFDVSADVIQAALEFAGYTAAQINQWLVGQIAIENVISGYTQGYHGLPIATPSEQFPLRPGQNQITIRGAALLVVTSIAGLPSGARATITGRGTGNNGRMAYWTYLHVQIDVPTRTRPGTTGRAVLSLGSSRGPSFNWIVQVPEQRTSGRMPPSTGGSRGTAQADLVPLNMPNVLYKVGSATTMDANGDTFTALDPFNDSAHCQGIPQGGTARNNMPTSNTRQITVPDIRWGVENTSSVDVTDAFTIQLLQGRRVVASQLVNGLRAGEQAEFTFRRPQSQTTVARVGPGAGCYHVGLRNEGWNDNDGFTVRVDTGTDIDEARENNNSRAM